MEENLLFVTIMTPHGTVDIDVDADVCRAGSGSIPCNGYKKRIPGGIVSNGILVSEGVRVIWSRR